VDYKRSRIKQYHKEGKALRTETHHQRDARLGVGRLLKNPPELRPISRPDCRDPLQRPAPMRAGVQ